MSGWPEKRSLNSSDTFLLSGTVIMTQDRPRVILFKSGASKDEDPYADALTATGLVEAVESVPVIAFNFVNQELMVEKLNHPERYSGVIFTSPR